jgi:hypothetical protein
VVEIFSDAAFSGASRFRPGYDDLRAGFKGTVNAMFLADLAVKTRRGLQGRIAGGCAFGYDVLRETDAHGEPVHGRLAISVVEATTVRRIFEMFAAGDSPIAIAHALNVVSVPGPDGRTWRDTTIRSHGPRGTGILRNARRYAAPRSRDWRKLSASPPT